MRMQPYLPLDWLLAEKANAAEKLKFNFYDVLRAREAVTLKYKMQFRKAIIHV